MREIEDGRADGTPHTQKERQTDRGGEGGKGEVAMRRKIRVREEAGVATTRRDL